MTNDFMVATFWRRFVFASMLWLIAWPILWYFKIGDITGPKAWFWIIGELNYPVVAAFFVLLDSVVNRLIAKPWIAFAVVIGVITIIMPFYYERYGFVLGVSLEARLF